MRIIDNVRREEEIFEFIVESYIQEHRPVSSGFLCKKFGLPYSSATVRNIMESLERKGYLSHLHISSGRVPTQEGFKHYVRNIKNDVIEKEIENIKEQLNDLEFHQANSWEETFYYILDILSKISGYASIVAIEGERQRWISFRGVRFIVDQPEFEDIVSLRKIFYLLEEKLQEFQELLFRYIGEDVRVLIGDDVGYDDIVQCSLVISSWRDEDWGTALALLGPMRMNYVRSIASIKFLKSYVEDKLKELKELF